MNSVEQAVRPGADHDQPSPQPPHEAMLRHVDKVCDRAHPQAYAQADDEDQRVLKAHRPHANAASAKNTTPRDGLVRPSTGSSMRSGSARTTMPRCSSLRYSKGIHVDRRNLILTINADIYTFGAIGEECAGPIPLDSFTQWRAKSTSHWRTSRQAPLLRVLGQRSKAVRPWWRSLVSSTLRCCARLRRACCAPPARQ